MSGDQQKHTQHGSDVFELPAGTRDFILSALDATGSELARTHGLRATRRLLVEEGTLLTQDNSFRINHLNHLLLVNLMRSMLAQSQRADVDAKSEELKTGVARAAR